MNHIKLNNGKLIPQLGLGVWKAKGEECYNSVKSALEIGYRHIDTATIYENEEFVGQAIKDSKIPREELFITTKLWNADQRNSNQRNALEESLKKLQLDYVDLYLIHWPIPEKIKESWKLMEEFYKEGLTKSIGVSNFLEEHIEEIKSFSNLMPAINQIELHPYLVQNSLTEYCKKHSIAVESWSPLGQGGKNNLLQSKTILKIAEKYKKSAAQVILRWNMDKGLVTIPKSSNPNRQKENLSIFDFNLTIEEVKTIDALDCNDRLGADPKNVNF